MTRAVLLVALLALGACAARELPAPEGVAGNDPRLRQCRSEATSSPAVNAIRRRMPPPGYGDAYARANEQIEAAEYDAFTSCLVREGALALPPGGVERVRQNVFDATPLEIPGSALPQAQHPAPSGY